jgi:hypothetical protein
MTLKLNQRKQSLILANLKFVIKITKPNKVVLRRLSRIKRLSFNYSKRHYVEGDKINLLVIYKPGITNEGTYYTWPDFLNAWESFTDEDLIADALTY